MEYPGFHDCKERGLSGLKKKSIYIVQIWGINRLLKTTT